MNWKPVLISVCLTPIFLFLGAMSTGAGHGSYLVTKLLFPFTMLSTVAFHSIRIPFVVLAIIQFPIYGIVLGVGLRHGRLHQTVIWLIVLHSLALAGCLLFVNQNFS